MSHLEVLHTGPGCLIEDLGRPGLAGQGVTLSGALDRRSLIDGNRLVGNTIGAAGIEALLGGALLRASADTIVAVTGAWCPTSIDAAPAPFGTAVLVRGGSTLGLGRSEHGLRTYVTVRGGLQPPGAFGGSWSTDTSSGLGPAAIRAGTLLPIGSQIASAPLTAQAQPAVQPDEIRLTLTPGPRDIGDRARALLVRGVGTIDPHSDRIGIRINGFQLVADSSSGTSEAIPLGAVQAPPSGELIVFMADHPTTGGYPVIGVVDALGLDALAQCAPGTRVRFTLRPAPTY